MKERRDAVAKFLDYQKILATSSETTKE